MCKMEWMKKIIIIWIGSIIAAYGITLAMYAGFGGATLAVLWQGISKTFHISIGMASMIVAVVMIIFVFFYDRSQLHIGTVLYQIVYSLCVDLFANAHIYVDQRTAYAVGYYTLCNRNRFVCGGFSGTRFL